MANGIQQVNQQRSNPQSTTTSEPPVTTVTTAEGLTYFSADVPSLGGVPLIVQAVDEESVRRIYHRECEGLSPGAFIAVKPATDIEIKRATEENRVKA